MPSVVFPSSFRSPSSYRPRLDAPNHQHKRINELITDANDDAGSRSTTVQLLEKCYLSQNAERVAPFQAPVAFRYMYVCHVSPLMRQNGDFVGPVFISDPFDESNRSSTIPLPSLLAPR